MKTITKESVSDHVDDLIDYSKQIKVGKITILTGSNGSGKSLLRKLIGSSLTKNNKLVKVASVSMERRAGLNLDGAMGAFTKDAEWEPTSRETIKLINGLLSQQERFIVIDEAEIGMGDELVLGLVNMLNEKLNKNPLGALIITHSRVIVENLKHDHFINLNGMKHKEWLTREIVPMDIETLYEQSNLIFREVQNRIDAKSKQK